MAGKRKTVKVEKVPNTKPCPKCARVLPITNFYPHREWRKQAFHDAWCKDCALRIAVDENGLKEYCYENNRKWNQTTYDSACNKAQMLLESNLAYNSVTVGPEERQRIASETIAKAFFSIMNLVQYYKYVDNGVTYVTSVPEIEFSYPDDEESKNVDYNKRWRGYFTPEQIEVLEDIYAKYENDFDLSDASLQDYAMKVVKASFHADQVYDQMRRGEATVSDYKDAQKIFDDLSKSSNFAACKRKPGETTGMGSLGEIILRIEGTGKLNVDGDNWPQDSVDLAINEYRHTLIAAGKDGAI